MTVETFRHSHDNDQTVYLSYDNLDLDGSRVKALLSQYLNNESIKPIKALLGTSQRHKDDQPNRKIGNNIARNSADLVDLTPITESISFNTLSVSDKSILTIKFKIEGADKDYRLIYLRWVFGKNKDDLRMFSGAPEIIWYLNNEVNIQHY